MFCYTGIPEKRKSVIELVVLATFHNWVIPTKNRRMPKLHVFVYTLVLSFLSFYQTVSHDETTYDFFTI